MDDKDRDFIIYARFMFYFSNLALFCSTHEKYKLLDKSFFMQAKKELEELEQQLVSLEKQTDFSRDSSVSLRSVGKQTDFSRDSSVSLRSVGKQTDFSRDSSVSLRLVKILTDFSRISTDSPRSVEKQRDFFRDSST